MLLGAARGGRDSRQRQLQRGSVQALAALVDDSARGLCGGYGRMMRMLARAVRGGRFSRQRQWQRGGPTALAAFVGGNLRSLCGSRLLATVSAAFVAAASAWCACYCGPPAAALPVPSGRGSAAVCRPWSAVCRPAWLVSGRCLVGV